MLRRRTRIRQLAATLAVVAVVLAGSAAPASAATVAGPEEVDLLRLHNEARAQHGRAPLADDLAARDVARDWARSMADRGVLSHNPNLASQVGSRVTAHWTRIGENVGRGTSVASIFQAFMASTAHRNNILGDYNRVGVGAARDGRGQLWVAVVFVKGPAIPVVPTSTWAPFANPSTFVAQQYLDFLGRAADPGGLEAWTTLLRYGRISGPGIVESFMNSNEFGVRVAPVVRLYFAAFTRIPDYGGLQAWLGFVRAGGSPLDVARGFAGSREFTNRYGGMTNRQFVDALYRNVLGRPADPSGLDHWAGGLDRGQWDRGFVLHGLAQSNEHITLSRSEVAVTMAYVGMLRRSPDSGGFAHWVGLLDRGSTVQHLAGGFLASSEYRNRVT